MEADEAEDEEETEEAGDDLCDLCMSSGVHVDRTTPCGKTIGIECGCDEGDEDGVCGNEDCAACAAAASAALGSDQSCTVDCDCEHDCNCYPEGECSACHGKRYLISTRDDGRKAVERCDECSADAMDDEAAAVLAARDGVRCEPTYPCCLTEKIREAK